MAMATTVRQLAVGVGGGLALSAPVQVVDVGSSALVHVTAELHESLRALDEDGEQVGRDDVDRQDVRAPRDAGVVVTASSGPSRFTWLASARDWSRSARSPMTADAPRLMSGSAAASRPALRVWTI